VEERVVGSEDAGIGSGGIVSVDRRYPVIVYVGTRSTIFHLQTYHLHPPDHDYQYSLP
jgi:hypothetical protein